MKIPEQQTFVAGDRRITIYLTGAPVTIVDNSQPPVVIWAARSST